MKQPDPRRAPMTDIVERLRAGWVSHMDAEKAAAEIERLSYDLAECQRLREDVSAALGKDRIEIGRLRAALRRIATHDGIDCLAADPSMWASQVAATALRDKP